MEATGSAAPRAFGARRDVVAACCCFVLSGAAGLVYQVAWERLLALTTGVGVHSVAIITAAFMAGLGIGSYFGGVLSVRLTPRRSLLAFAVVELGVAVFAAFSVPIYYGLLYRQAAGLYDGLMRATLTHFLSLLPPTCLMGMSLPLLARGLVRDREDASFTIGVLYGANALGASAGALLTPWVLLKFLGVTGAVAAGAVASAAAALGAVVIVRGSSPSRAAIASAEPNRAADRPAEAAQPFSRWVALYAFSGFVSLSLEIAWFRVLHVAAKDAAFAFGTLLSVYLFGLAGGTFLATRRAVLVQRPLLAFLSCQAGIVLWTLLAHALLVWLPSGWPGVSWVVSYSARPVGVSMAPFDGSEFLVVYLALPLLLFGPSTFLMGLGFPILQSAAQADPVLSGFRTGVLQAANIVGCILGSLGTGLLLLDAIGTSGVLRTLAVLTSAVTLLGLKMTRQQSLAPLAATLLVAAVVFPPNDRLWLRLHGNPADAMIEEDAASVTALTSQPGGYKLWINGRYNSWLPFGGIHTMIGALPAIVHRAPGEVAVIGLGSGDTAWGAGCRQETRSLTVFEIASSQVRLLSRVADMPLMGSLQRFLSDPRMTIVKDDGRRRLRADGRTYDVIVADAIWQDVSMSGFLYSVEYYELVKQTLKPGGLLCVLAKTPRVHAAVRRVFPFCVRFGEDLLLMSGEPILIDKQTWLARARSSAVVDYLGFRTRQLAQVIDWASYDRTTPRTTEVNRDLDPRDEFLRPIRQ